MSGVTGDSRLQSQVLEELSDARAYRRWLADIARPYLGPNPIEVGSGNGDYALEWVTGVTAFTATEADEDRFKALYLRLADHPVITTRWLFLGDEAGPPAPDTYASELVPPPRDHSAAIAVNVLEHIPDDVGALRHMSRLVRPGGAIVLLVPAFPSAMSRFDRAIGHMRRYTRSSTRAALCAAGLEVERVRYVNPIGLVAWYIAVKGLRRTPSNGRSLRAYDRTVVPIARLADRLPVPFGQSVFAVGRVPG